MKLILTIKSGSLSGQTYELTTGHLSIGRSQHCSIRFDPIAEKIVSGQHAFIEYRPEGFFITDNSSTNGTYVNRQKVQNRKLQAGDFIHFGIDGVEVSVEIVGDGKVSEADKATVAMTPNALDQMQIEHISKAYKNQPQQLSVKNTIAGIGLGHLDVEPVQPPVGKYIVIGAMIFLVVILLVPVLLIVGLSLGPIVAIVATVVAFIPASIYILPLIWLDRYDPEPLWLLALAFAWGAVVAVFASYVINTIFGSVAAIATGNFAIGQLLSAIISAPIFEEGSKGIGLLLLLIFFRRNFDGILDGIIFGGVIALGFATVENILYYGRGILQGGAQGLALLFLLRGILSPFAHVTFTAMTGIGCGISRESHNGLVRIAMPVLGYILAVAFHALWNSMAILFIFIIRATGINQACYAIGMTGEYEGICAFLIGYSILEIPLFVILVGFTIYIMVRQNRILKEMLAIDVARGMIPQEHLDKVTSAFSSLIWSLSGITEGKYMARRRYMRAIGKLGLSYWHIQRATVAQGQTGSFQQNPILREEVLKWRNKV